MRSESEKKLLRIKGLRGWFSFPKSLDILLNEGRFLGHFSHILLNGRPLELHFDHFRLLSAPLDSAQDR